MSYKKVALGAAVFFIAAALLVPFSNNKVRAQETPSESEILKKLDNIIKGQKDILNQIADIKAQLNIIKIRVSQQQ